MIEITFFFIIIFLACSLYLSNFKKKSLTTILIFTVLLISTAMIYLKKGNLDSYSFEDKLNSIIEKGLKDPQLFKDISPEILITYLEKKLKTKPEDLEGWLILARTCVISGHYQKADLHYKNALKKFPVNEDILLEYSILKKNSNQTKSAEKYLNKLKDINPTNIKARELLIEIYTSGSLKVKAIKELDELLEITKDDQDYLKRIKKKYNLR